MISKTKFETNKTGIKYCDFIRSICNIVSLNRRVACRNNRNIELYTVDRSRHTNSWTNRSQVPVW